MSTTDIYRVFAERETRGVSPAYERLSRAVAGDPELLALLDTLPPAKRQPNLLFGVVRLHGGPVDDPAAFRAYVIAHWPDVAAQMRVSKMTVYRLVHAGDLSAVRVGRSFRVPEQAVHQYLRQAYSQTA